MLQLCPTLWSVAHQVPLPMGFSRQEYWNGWSCLSLGDLPDPGIEPESLELVGVFFTTNTTWEAHSKLCGDLNGKEIQNSGEEYMYTYSCFTLLYIF